SSNKASADVKPLTADEIELLRCLSDDIVPRWRLLDGREVSSVEAKQNDGATVVWAELGGESSFALCRGRRRLGRVDHVSGYSSVDSLSLEGDFLEVRPNRHAFALVVDEGFYESDDPDVVEGDEHERDGKRIILLALTDGGLQTIWSNPVRALYRLSGF